MSKQFWGLITIHNPFSRVKSSIVIVLWQILFFYIFSLIIKCIFLWLNKMSSSLQLGIRVPPSQSPGTVNNQKHGSHVNMVCGWCWLAGTRWVGAGCSIAICTMNPTSHCSTRARVSWTDNTYKLTNSHNLSMIWQYCRVCRWAMAGYGAGVSTWLV